MNPDVIHLIGPGGAGKSTTGSLLAQRLGLRFVDLDARFTVMYGDISEYLNAQGYAAYATVNVQAYLDIIEAETEPLVLALSSGFMTYPLAIDPQYGRCRENIATSPTTFVLLPSLEREICVAEIVRRQMGRPFSRSAAKEEAVIRERFEIYIAIPVHKVETMQPVDEVCDEIAVALAACRYRRGNRSGSPGDSCRICGPSPTCRCSGRSSRASGG